MYVVQDSRTISTRKPRGEKLNTEPQRPPTVLMSCSPEVGLPPRRTVTGSRSVWVGSTTETDTQLDAGNYNLLTSSSPLNKLI